MTKHPVSFIVFGLVCCLASCRKETKIGYLASYGRGLSGAVALAIDQINK